jgi:hypothetical protein
MLVKRQGKRYAGLFAAVLVIAGFLAGLQPLGEVHAQSATSSANTLRVTPVRSDIQIKPGERQTVRVTVANVTNNKITVRAVSNDFIASPQEDGSPALILDADEYAPTHSLKRFMTAVPDFDIPANQGRTIDVLITVPANAQAGGYFGAIRFAPTDPTTGGQVNLSASVASLILLNVPGPTEEKLSLTDFEIRQGDKKGTDFRTSNDLKAYFRFQNMGNVQLGPFGKVSVTQGDTVVYDADFNTQSPKELVLPDSARRWEIPLKNIGEFGYYTVSATFTYGSKNQTIEVSQSFWVIPQYMIIIAIVVAALLVLGIAALVYYLVRRNKRGGGGRLRRANRQSAHSGMRRIR